VVQDCRGEDKSASVCVSSCSDDDDCTKHGNAFVCRSGECLPPLPLQPDPCEALDATSNGDDCAQVVGYTFNGVSCEAVNCGCEGSECDALYSSMAECDRSRNECYTRRGVDLECTTHSDCVLAQRYCCGGLTGADQAIALVADTASTYYDLVCEAIEGCPAVYIPPKESVYATCVNNHCEAIDVESVATRSSDDDCLVRSKSCCTCDVLAPDDLLAVSDTEGYESFANCDGVCPECVSSLPDDVSAVCDDSGLCALQVE
jgi:hypothetical protein